MTPERLYIVKQINRQYNKQLDWKFLRRQGICTATDIASITTSTNKIIEDLKFELVKLDYREKHDIQCAKQRPNDYIETIKDGSVEPTEC